jgi:hypothetical protein
VSNVPGGSITGVITGVGSVPGLDPKDIARRVLDELPELPHVPELPERGPWAGMVGRSCALLVDLPTELEVGRWRVAQRSGRDVGRARSMLAEDLDAVEEGWAGFTGNAKLQVCGPLTLAAVLELRGGDAVVSDPGALADVTASLAEGVVAHLEDARSRLPDVDWVVQIDEPALPAVTLGAIARASGWGTLAALTSADAGRWLATVVAAVHSAGATTVAHCCADAPDLEALDASGVDALSLDVSRLDLERFGPELERWYHDRGHLWCGVEPEHASIARSQLTALRAVLDITEHELAESVVLTPPCGLATTADSSTRVVGAALYADLRQLHRRLTD